MSNCKIKVIHNKSPDFGKVDFLCDEPICPTLDKFPLVRDNMNVYHCTAIIGRNWCYDNGIGYGCRTIDQ